FFAIKCRSCEAGCNVEVECTGSCLRQLRHFHSGLRVAGRYLPRDQFCVILAVENSRDSLLQPIGRVGRKGLLPSSYHLFNGQLGKRLKEKVLGESDARIPDVARRNGKTRDRFYSGDYLIVVN